MEAILLIIGLIIGCLLCYFVLRPKIKNTNKLNEEIKKQNDQQYKANEVLQKQKTMLLD